MRTIKYKNKNTTAGTQYRSISKNDRNWVLDQCRTVSGLVDVCAKTSEFPLCDIGVELTAATITLPRQSTGKRNSVKSFVDGVLTNFQTGQYDLSDKTMAGVTESFMQASAHFTSVDAVEFVEESVVPTSTEKSVMEDLFDIESITVTYKRKK